MPTKSKKAVAKTSSLRNLIDEHEHALLVALAYVIGFTTAFIAFHLAEQSRAGFAADFVGSDYHFLNDEEPKAEILVKEGSLFVTKAGKERVLSAKTDGMQAEDGFHLRIITASVSPNNNFVYYCVQIREGSNKCMNYVYSMETDEVHRVKTGDEQLVSVSEETGDFGWQEDGSLTLGDLRSSDNLKPWVLN